MIKRDSINENRLSNIYVVYFTEIKFQSAVNICDAENIL